MKRTHRSLLLLLFAAVVSTACEQNAWQDITAPLPESSARIKFFNFGVGSPGVNFYANDAKLTAISSTTCAVLTDANREQCTTNGAESTVGVNYGAAASGALYLTVPAGQYTFSGRIAAATDKDLPISSVPVALAGGKAYSYYQSGIYNSATKNVDAFVVEDPFIPSFDYSAAYVRFVHAVSNANPMTLLIREQTGPTEVAVGELVAYKSASAFVKVPPGPYDLFARYAGATTNALSRTAVGFSPGRVYTITARGNITVASTLLLDNTLNR